MEIFTWVRDIPPPQINTIFQNFKENYDCFPQKKKPEHLSSSFTPPPPFPPLSQPTRGRRQSGPEWVRGAPPLPSRDSFSWILQVELILGFCCFLNLFPILSSPPPPEPVGIWKKSKSLRWRYGIGVWLKSSRKSAEGKRGVRQPFIG